MVTIKLGSIYLEINQTEINITKHSSPKTYSLANGGEIAIPCVDRLSVINFSGFLYDLDSYNAIIAMLKSASPVQFYVSGLNIPLNMSVIIQNFNTVERGGDIDCIEYSITLKEFESYDVSVISSGNTQTTTPETLTIPTLYVVKKGDTLWAIAKQFLGDPLRYPELATLNNIKNPNLIYIGQEIRIS